MKISDITKQIEAFAPLAYQEDYDNCGLLTGDKNWEATGALLTLDCTEEVVDEAIKNNCNLIIAHHPIIFSGLKKITGKNFVEWVVIKAIKNDVAIYAAHTNIDHVSDGVNKKICNKLGLTNTKILLPKNDLLKKLSVYVPIKHSEKVLDTLFEAGAGNIGNYSHCSFSLEGKGSFRGNESSNPFAGEKGKRHFETENKLEVVFPAHLQNHVISNLLRAHPYEEVAYDIFKLDNPHSNVGSGMIGKFTDAMDSEYFLKFVKNTFNCGVLRHTIAPNKTIKNVAVCGGSGKFLLQHAILAGADAFITSDFKYHDFFEVEGKLLLIDAGHYETEQFTPEIFYELINKKFPTFAIRLSEINTNPVNYF
jgi:dinuclear metal center YbgI/SA1388 family protein